MSFRALGAGKEGSEKLCNYAAAAYTLPCYLFIFKLLFRAARYVCKDRLKDYGQWEGWKPEEPAHNDTHAAQGGSVDKLAAKLKGSKVGEQLKPIILKAHRGMLKDYGPWEGWTPSSQDEPVSWKLAQELGGVATSVVSIGPLSWPYSWNETFRHKCILATYMTFLFSGYVSFILLSGCEFKLLCVPMEEQPAEERMLQIIEMLGRGGLIFWIAGVPQKVTFFGPIKLTALCIYEYFVSQFFFYSCEMFLPHSASSVATFNRFATYCGFSMVFALVNVIAGGFPSLSRRSKYYYAIYVVCAIPIHAVVSAASSVNRHYYHIAFVVALLCIFPSTISLIVFVKIMMLFIDGRGLWAAEPDSLDENDTVGAEQGKVSRLSAAVSVAVMIAIVVSVLRSCCKSKSSEDNSSSRGDVQSSEADAMLPRTESGVKAISPSEPASSEPSEPSQPKPKSKRAPKRGVKKSDGARNTADAPDALGKPVTEENP